MNALLYDAISQFSERRTLGPIRLALIAPLRGCIVEVGAGTGASFPYYDASVHVLAIEPDRSMAKRAEQRAARSPADIEMLRCSDLVLEDLPDASADHVVAMLVLCSVKDPRDTLRRIHRVLKPEGTYIFVEHVRGRAAAARIQDILTPAWTWLFGNCHLNRQIERRLAESGFQAGGLGAKRIALPMWQLVYGFATKV